MSAPHAESQGTGLLSQGQRRSHSPGSPVPSGDNSAPGAAPRAEPKHSQKPPPARSWTSPKEVDIWVPFWSCRAPLLLTRQYIHCPKGLAPQGLRHLNKGDPPQAGGAALVQRGVCPPHRDCLTFVDPSPLQGPLVSPAIYLRASHRNPPLFCLSQASPSSRIIWGKHCRPPFSGAGREVTEVTGSQRHLLGSELPQNIRHRSSRVWGSE